MANSTARKTVGNNPWLSVGSLALGTFVVVTTEFLPIGLLGPMATDMGISTGTAGLMVTIPGIVAAISAPVITLFAKTTDRRHLLIGFAALVVLANVIVAIAPQFEMILFGRVLLGIAVGGIWTFAVAVGRRLVPDLQGGRATALILAGVSCGAVVGVPIGTALGALAGWRVAFGSVAAVACLVLFAQAFLLPALHVRQIVSFRMIRDFLKIPTVSLGFLATLLITAGHFAAYTYLEPLLSQKVLLSPTGISWVFAAYGLAGVIGTFLGERATARNLRLAFAGTSILLGLAILVAARDGNPTMVISSVILWGIAFGAVPICIQIWTFNAAPAQFETGSALMVTVFQIGIAAGSWGGGAIVDQAGIATTFTSAGLLTLGCAALLLLAGKSTKRK